MEQLTEKITAVRDELAKVQAKIPAKDSNSAVSKDKETFKQLFDSLLNQKKGAFWLYIWAFGITFHILIYRSTKEKEALV